MNFFTEADQKKLIECSVDFDKKSTNNVTYVY